MNLLEWIGNTLGNFVRGNSKMVVSVAKNNLEGIGEVFNTTIANYRKHAKEVTEAAELYSMEVERLERQKKEAQKAETELLSIANQAETMASKIETTLGLGKGEAA